MPALVAWLAGWGLLTAATHLHTGPGWALLIALLPAMVLAPKASPGWRRILVLAGLPVMLGLLQGLAAVPPWAWLAVAALLLALYPVQVWRDAPLYPTAPDALMDLPRRLTLPDGARVLDAGSGLGHGLLALRRAYPQAQLLGVERSLLLRLLSHVWARWTWRRLPGRRDGGWRVSGGDFWALSWAEFDLVYLFQRPESMPQAWVKARHEMRSGAWLVSLEFPIPGEKPQFELRTPGGRWLGAYRIPERGISVQGAAGR